MILVVAVKCVRPRVVAPGVVLVFRRDLVGTRMDSGGGGSVWEQLLFRPEKLVKLH